MHYYHQPGEIEIRYEKSENEEFKRKRTMHEKTKHTKNISKCQQCDYSKTSKDLLKMHIESNHEHKQFNCEQCDYKANNKDQLQNHVK